MFISATIDKGLPYPKWQAKEQTLACAGRSFSVGVWRCDGKDSFRNFIQRWKIAQISGMMESSYWYYITERRLSELWKKAYNRKFGFRALLWSCLVHLVCRKSNGWIIILWEQAYAPLELIMSLLSISFGGRAHATIAMHNFIVWIKVSSFLWFAITGTSIQVLQQVGLSEALI